MLPLLLCRRMALVAGAEASVSASYSLGRSRCLGVLATAVGGQASLSCSNCLYVVAGMRPRHCWSSALVSDSSSAWLGSGGWGLA